jgi:hypothetical protein
MQNSKSNRALPGAVIGVLSGAVLLGMTAVAYAQSHAPTLQQRFRPGPTASGHTVAPTTTVPPATTTISNGGQATAQKTRLAQYVDKTNATIHAGVHANGKEPTQDERNLVKEHWRITMRLERIRDLAEDASDTATVNECDADLAAMDAHLQTTLVALNAKAPK